MRTMMVQAGSTNKTKEEMKDDVGYMDAPHLFFFVRNLIFRVCVAFKNQKNKAYDKTRIN